MDKALDKIIKKHIVLTCLTALCVVCMMITITYGLYQTNHKNTVDQEIAIGEFDVNLTSNSGQITLVDLNPGDTGNTSYTFTTSNSGDYTVSYNVYLTDNTSTFLSNSTNATTYSGYTQITEENYAYINYSLDGGEARSLSDVYDSSTGKMTIINSRLQPSEVQNHSITFSISSSAPNSLQGSIFALNITMDASASKENGADKIMQLVADSPSNSLDVITKTAPSGASCTNTLAYDGTVDNNLRYVGANPCNYVTFNDETAGWRIIGVMNNIDDGTGKKATRIKLVRKDSLGSYSWDTSTTNSGRGSNNWELADLNAELNGDYLNSLLSADTSWYNGENDAQTGIFDHTKVLKADAQNFIDNAVYTLGGHSTNAVTSSAIYNIERGTTVYTGGTSRPTKWTGKIALMYPSDFGFAVGGSVRSTCLPKNLNAYLESDCYTNDWILHTDSYQWLLTPRTNYAYMASVTRPSGTLNLNNCADAYAVKPAFYLRENVNIKSGDGSPENPYVIS